MRLNKCGCLVMNTKGVASIKITEMKCLSFDGNFTMGLGMLFQKVKPVQLYVSTLRLL
jgi:hypothetical protein